MDTVALSTWPLLLPVVALSAWWIRERGQRTGRIKRQHGLSQQYLRGLNLLLNEQPDAAVDTFIKLLEVDSNTVETHLALGHLFRRRGEVDRAIRIHQNLIARPQLPTELRLQALLALGQDYLAAGVLDRAERVLQQVVETGNKQQTTTSLELLLTIYQQEKSWQAAIRTAKQIQRVNGKSLQQTIAHHYCELATQRLQTELIDQAKKYIKHALVHDHNSVRATLLQAQVATQQGQLKVAIKAYRRVADQDPQFISEIVKPLMQCHINLGSTLQGISYLQQLLQQHPRIAIALTLAEHIKQTQGLVAASEFITQQLQRMPSIQGLHQLISWDLASTEDDCQSKFQILKDLSQQLLANKPLYQCHHCGFSGKILHWYCPGCKQWNTVKPISDSESYTHNT